jgi:hypothetical protein
MPEISQHYRNQRLAPLSGVGQLSSADIQAATQGNRELAKAGEAATEFGIQFMQQKEKAEYHNQLNTARTEYLTKFFNYEQDLQTNADTETYIPNLKTGQTSSYKFTNKRAANEFELWKANEDLSQTRRVFGAKQTQDVQNYTQNWNLGIKEATRRTASAIPESDYQLELANGMDYFGLEYATEEKDGEPVPVLDEKGEPKIQLIEDWENPLLDTDEVRFAGYESWKADADAKRKVNIQEQFTVGIEAQAFRIAADQGYPAAEEMLNDPATVAGLIEAGMDRKDISSLLNDVEKRLGKQQAADQLELESRQETQLDDINKLTFDTKDYNAASVAVEASELDEKTQRTLLSDIERRAAAVVEEKPLKNDRVEENRLYEMSLGIWNGSVTKKEFDAELVANQHKLDDGAYKSVSKSAVDTLKTSQAQSLSRANTEAGRLIVDHTSEDAFQKFIADTVAGLKPEAANLFRDEANEIRQEQFFSLSQYNAELRDWIAENPDKIGKDFFQFSESLKHVYWNKSRQDIQENIVEARKGEAEKESLPSLLPVQAPDKAAYDKLSSGTRYIDKNGNIGTKR